MDWSSLVSDAGTGAAVGTAAEPGLGTLVGAGVGLASNLIGSLFQNHLNQQNVDAMNAYNSPAAQMARLKAAGLNPALMYTQGSMGNQAQPVQMTFGMPNGSVDPMLHIEHTLAAQEALARIRNLGTGNRLTESKVNQSDSATRGIDLNNVLKQFGLDLEQVKSQYYGRMAASQVAVQEATFQRIMSMTNLSDAQKLEVMKNLSWMDQLKGAELSKTQQETTTEQMRQRSIEADLKLKKATQTDKEYNNSLHDFGMERGDNQLLRIFLQQRTNHSPYPFMRK